MQSRLQIFQRGVNQYQSPVTTYGYCILIFFGPLTGFHADIGALLASIKLATAVYKPYSWHNFSCKIQNSNDLELIHLSSLKSKRHIYPPFRKHEIGVTESRSCFIHMVYTRKVRQIIFFQKVYE